MQRQDSPNSASSNQAGEMAEKKAEKSSLYENYTLIGMSGSGKSSIGAILAKKIGYQFIDSDVLITQRFKKPLQSIVNRYRKDFRNYINLERRVFESKLYEKTVIATGGSLCYSPRSIQRNKGVVVYLQVNWPCLVKRVGDFQGRGLVLLSKNQKTEFAKRIPMYERMADFKIQCTGLSILEIANRIVALDAYTC